MTKRDRICFVYAKSLEGKPDHKVIGVQAMDLMTAFGPEACKREFGVDVAKIRDAMETAQSARLLELDNEIEELTEMVEAGFKEAAKELDLAKQEATKIRTGQLVPKPVVEVQVGKLRRLVMDQREAKQQAKQAEKAPAPTIVATKSS